MNFRPLGIACSVVWLLLIARFGAAAAPAPAAMNVVVILADDLGWTDLGCYGSDLYETPHLDQLARDGMRFTQAYSACTVCSPTRASLLTGMYPARLHVTDWIPGLLPANPKLLIPDWTKHLPSEATTLAEVFRSEGYATASIGKWHLGDESDYPTAHGFDRNVAGTRQPSPPSYFAPYQIATLPEGPAGEYLTDRLAEEAVQYVRAQRDRRFFLYWPHFAVHLPIQGPEPLAARFRARVKPEGRHTNPVYAAMISSLDEAVGRLRATLAELGLADRTVLVFTSDNGGHIPTTSNHPLRYGKASCYEGGTRVPCIVHWPGVTQPGSVCDVPVITPDLFPTVLDMAGISADAARQTDGVSLTGLLRQTGKLNREALYWHYPHYQLYQRGGTTPYGAIRQGDWKLIEVYDDMHVELYNLADDPGEQRDRAAERPDQVANLRRRLHAWRESVGAQMPSPNPNYDPARPQHVPRKKKAAAQSAAKRGRGT
ncbi:MAG: sulfatase [Pirellulaceae bacterium]